MRLFTRSLLVALLSLTAIASAAPAQAAGPRNGRWAPTIVRPESRPYGYTYGQWSAAWWRWATSVPAPVNPLLDPTGANCGQGQRGPVFFLAGMIPAQGTVTRNLCRVPANRSLFVPILNCENDNTVPVTPPPGPQAVQNLPLADLVKFCKDSIDTAQNMAAEIDGWSIAGLTQPTRFRVTAPTFSITPPSDSLYAKLGLFAPAGQTIYPAIAEGVYVMIAPLRRGWHKLHFHGQLGQDQALDVTYNLWVG